MNKQEIVNALEALKDYVNDNGKRELDRIKGAVNHLQEREIVVSVEPEAEDHLAKKTKKLSHK